MLHFGAALKATLLFIRPSCFHLIGPPDCFGTFDFSLISLCKRSAADPAADPKNIPDLSGWMLLVVKYDSAPFFDPPHLPLMLDVRLQWGVTSA